MQTYPSIYLGIVVQNNDPEFRGRVKVWVPHVNAGIYNKWAALKKDRNFKFPGLNINSDLSLVIENVKDELPWAEYCGPVAGEVATGQYNAFSGQATTSDAVYPYSLSGSNYSDHYAEYRLNDEKMGEKPGFVYEKYGTKLVDAFTDTSTNKTSQINQNGAQYRPSTYSNAAKGVFSIPNVGAHIWVFFRDGMPMYPVYMGASLGQDDFKSIFKSEDDTYQDYPQTFESVGKNIRNTEDVNTETYRNKMVVNQRGAAIEIINTTDRERFKVTHFSGGFLELNNKYNSLFSPKNLQLLTLRDKFETIRGHDNYFVNRDSDNTIQGNYLLKTGNLNKTAMDEWVTAYTAIATILAKPESQDKSNLVSTVTAQAEALAAAEAKLGFGGNYIETITKHKFSNVGLVFNTFASTRYNGTDKTITHFRNVISGGTGIVTTTIDAIEYTHIDDMPGGNLTETVGNRWSMLVGSGGIDIKTTGPVNLGGTIMALAGKQVNIASSDDMNIDGGTNLSVIASIMTLRTRNRDQVVIDDNLGISKNLIIGGGSYTEGEMYLQHITAPVEFQVTESTQISAPATMWSISGATISGTGTGPGGCYKSGDIVTLGSTGTLAITKPHTHYFKNMPLTLVADAAAVRTAAAALNGGSAAATAAPVKNGYNTAGGQLNSNPNGPVTGDPTAAPAKP
jgi:hypothetical protein